MKTGIVIWDKGAVTVEGLRFKGIPLGQGLATSRQVGIGLMTVATGGE
jgi:hypothetical protein